MPSGDPGSYRGLTRPPMLHGKLITLVAAMGRNRAIGLDGVLPWHLPRELRHFKEITMGRPIVMGRRTPRTRTKVPSFPSHIFWYKNYIFLQIFN